MVEKGAVVDDAELPKAKDDAPNAPVEFPENMLPPVDVAKGVAAVPKKLLLLELLPCLNTD